MDKKKAKSTEISVLYNLPENWANETLIQICHRFYLDYPQIKDFLSGQIYATPLHKSEKNPTASDFFITPADLMRKHSSYPRNNNIANVFFKVGFVESWGRGFKKIAEEFERANLPLPTIEEYGGGVTATILRKTIGNVGVNVGDGGDVAVIQLTNRQKLILSLIAKSLTITAKQMAVMTDIPQRTIERELSTLQKLSIICREGSPRTGSWVIINKRCLD